MIKSNGSITIALLGQPNVGKSTVFNMLTGLNQHVGNWPGKTVEFKIGHLSIENIPIHLVDLPGTYSLTANSTEERIARDFIIHEQPDLVIVIINAASLERNLYLVTELLALSVPIVIGLNMMDVADQQGFTINAKILQAALDIVVVPLIASKNQGLNTLITVAKDLAKKPQAFNPNLPKISSEHCEAQEKLQRLIKDHIDPHFQADWVALKLLEGDREILEKFKSKHSEVWPDIQSILLAHEDAILDITSGRYEWIAQMERAAILRPRPGKIVLTDRVDRVATHPFWGLVLLFGVFGLVFFLTYTIATPLVDWLQLSVVLPTANLMSNLLSDAPAWISGLVVNGLIGGVGTVFTFLPILILFFTTLGILEDVGYLARAAYVMDRFMHLMGLHGRSFLSLFIGFGCNVPAVMGTRIIEDKRAKLLTILLIPLVPCTARLAVIAFLAPAFFNKQAAFVTWLLVIINLSFLVLLGISVNRIIHKGDQSPFIMEIPIYHLPNLRTIGLYVWHNTFAFVKKAGGVIVIFSIIVWLFSWLPNGDLQTSFIARFGRWLAPVGGVMGLTDWRFIVALLTSFIAKENTIATLGILFGVSEQSVALPIRIASTVTPAAAFSFLIVQMLFIPCVATAAVIRQETRSWKFTLLSVVLLLVISISASVGFYQLARLLGWGM
jgi:ferrous iron transport protein B